MVGGGIRFDWGGHGVFLDGARAGAGVGITAPPTFIRMPESGGTRRVWRAALRRMRLSLAWRRNEMRRGKAGRNHVNRIRAAGVVEIAAGIGAGIATSSVFSELLGRYREGCDSGRPLRLAIVGIITPCEHTWGPRDRRPLAGRRHTYRQPLLDSCRRPDFRNDPTGSSYALKWAWTLYWK